jgi:hypothetical protein
MFIEEIMQSPKPAISKAGIRNVSFKTKADLAWHIFMPGSANQQKIQSLCLPLLKDILQGRRYLRQHVVGKVFGVRWISQTMQNVRLMMHNNVCQPRPALFRRGIRLSARQ